MGDIGVKFVDTDSDVDVLKATDEELAFTTKYFTLKQLDNADTQLFATSVTLPSSGGGPSVTFTHNLGYRPAFDIYLEDHNGRMFRVPGASDDLADYSCGIVLSQTVNSITVQVGYKGGATHGHTHNRAILCIIFIESGVV